MAIYLDDPLIDSLNRAPIRDLWITHCPGTRRATDVENLRRSQFQRRRLSARRTGGVGCAAVQ